MLPLFPCDSKLCTRMPIRVHVRRGHAEEAVLERWDVEAGKVLGDPRRVSIMALQGQKRPF